MRNRDLKQTEFETLKTFKKNRPSEYFSHLDTPESFQKHHAKVEALYRFGLMIPPEYFDGKSVIDLGAGTGENTISLARWGAKCTLVELNPDACEAAKLVFKKYASQTSVPTHAGHTFINSSLYDLELSNYREKFDISHSRGVFTHVGDKARAFHILAALVKPNGYVVYGDRNTLGGLQEMLQRFAIYQLGGTTDERIVEISEALFSEDIDRSQASVPRTRDAIIFDRWVIQQQDDPSVEEVLDFFDKEGLEYVSSWPRIDFPGRGASTYSNPIHNAAIRRGAMFVENLWMILNNGEFENVKSLEYPDASDLFYSNLVELGSLLRNNQINSTVNADQILGKIHKLNLPGSAKPRLLEERLNTFFNEIEDFLKAVSNRNDLGAIREKINGFEILFKGHAGVRHVDYVAYKPL